MTPLHKYLCGVFVVAAAASSIFLVYDRYVGNYHVYEAPKDSNLSKTRENFLSGSIGYAFPYFFLSTKAPNNKETWEKRAQKLRDRTSWVGQGVFEGLDKNSSDLENKIKRACDRAYHSPKPQESNDSWIYSKEWKDVFIVCKRA